MIGGMTIKVAAGVALALPIGAYLALDRLWVRPAAQMLWAELRDGETRGGDVEEALARALYWRAIRAKALPGAIISGETRSPGDGPWAAREGVAYYEKHYVGAPVLWRYRMAAWRALWQVLTESRKQERHFSAGAWPVAAWDQWRKVGEIKTSGFWVPVWVYGAAE